MIVSLHLTSLIIMFGACTGLMLSLLLWMVPWGNRRASHCLGALLAVSCGISVAEIGATEMESLPAVYHQLYILQFLPGPLIYFFSRLLTQPEFQWQPRHALHLLPAVLMALLWWLQLPLSPTGLLTLPCSTGDCDLMYRARFVHRLAVYLSLFGYGITVLGVLRPHLQRVKQNYSAVEKVNLSWLTALVYCYLAATLIGVTIELAGMIGWPVPFTTGTLQAQAPLLLTLLMGWFGLRQHRIHLPEQPTVQEATTKEEGEPTARKYQTSSLSDEGARAIWKALQQRMATDKPYLEAGLKIADLARTLSVPTHHLSETINSFTEQSFYEFINQHRVDEAAQMLLDDNLQHLSVTDIGLQAGFNSNSTFFSHFKKRLGLTPRQYRLRQQEMLTN
ncbi:AraC family transcriptional regulator [Microbulbifer aggregans]|uniref:AraC family transcriptional regulator n=1 Tax=Microbulbifer aggregans TaxID=1769779 RepID=UPI001CFDBBDC|nr:helix-turn-helix domain-containing protein [Microbulbifer aggregans]